MSQPARLRGESLRLSRQLAAVRPRQSASVWGTMNPGGQCDRKTRNFLHECISRPAAHPHAFSAFASPAGKARAMRMGCDENWPQWEWAAMMHDLIPTGRQWSAQAVRGDAAARRLAPISGAKTRTSLIEKMGDADTRNDHLSDADLPSQSALASLAEQPGDDAAKPRLPSRQAPERKKSRLLTIWSA